MTNTEKKRKKGKKHIFKPRNPLDLKFWLALGHAEMEGPFLEWNPFLVTLIILFILLLVYIGFTEIGAYVLTRQDLWKYFCDTREGSCTMWGSLHLPWWYAIRFIVAGPVWLASYWITSIACRLRWWRVAWFGMIVYGYCFTTILTAGMGESFLQTGIPMEWKWIIPLVSSILVALILSMGFLNRDLVVKMEKIETWMAILFGTGGGVAVFVSMLLGRWISGTNSISFVMIIGCISYPLMLIVIGRHWSDIIWVSNPWRLEKEIQMEAQEGEK